MPAPRHIQMRGEFQRVQTDPVNDDRKYIQDHVQSVAEHQQDNGKNHKHEVSKQRTCQFVYGCGDGRTRQTNGPESDIRNDIREHIYHAQQYRYDIGAAG